MGFRSVHPPMSELAGHKQANPYFLRDPCVLAFAVTVQLSLPRYILQRLDLLDETYRSKQWARVAFMMYIHLLCFFWERPLPLCPVPLPPISALGGS